MLAASWLDDAMLTARSRHRQAEETFASFKWLEKELLVEEKESVSIL